MAFRVIGIIGQAGHGKDTAAKMFAEILRLKRVSFADRLKEEIAGLFEDFPEASLETLMWGKKEPWVRRVLQVWGTEGRRYIDDRWWLKEWAVKALNAASEGFGGVIAADVRFPNEVDFITQECRGSLLYVDRGDFRLPHTNYDHPSERYIRELRDRAVHVIPNHGGLAEFKDACEAAMVALQ